MTKETIALINPPPEKIVEEYDTPPYGHIGLAYLASALRGHDKRCAVVDAKLERLDREGVLKRIADIGPEIIGITSHTHEINTAAGLAREIKRRTPRVKVVIGGIHASSLPMDTMREFDCYDFLIKGEGEYSFTELCDALTAGKEDTISRIPGLVYRKGGDIISGGQKSWITDLDSLGPPAWDLFPKMGIFPVISSRGCPYKCVFCARMLGDTVRLRSPENVAAELEFINEKFGAKKIYFYDETFGIYRDWLTRFLDLLIGRGLNKKLSWGITTRAQLIDEEILGLLKKAGCRKIDFGVESGDERILKIIKKGEDKEDFLRAARLVKRAHLESHAYFILGHPHETKESAMNTIDFAARLNTDHISIGIMIPYPGTEVASLAQKGEGGYKRVSLDWSGYNKQLGNALELENLSRAELTRLQLLGYLGFYVRNLKVLPFFSAMWRYRKLILAIMIKYLKAAMTEARRKE